MTEATFDPAALMREGIFLSDAVVIEFHEGAARDVYWATLHVGRTAVEIGTVRGPSDIATVLTMAAGVLMERYGYTDGIYISPDRRDRWVLIGPWVLNARLCERPNHLHLGSPAIARTMFNRLSGASDGT